MILYLVSALKNVKHNTNITVISVNENDYISLTDIAKHKSEDPTAVIGNWMRNRYGGTYAHKDIAFKFASWISVEFELYIVKEFQRLKQEEQKLIVWTAKRELSKINYHIHTDAIKQNLIPSEITTLQASVI